MIKKTMLAAFTVALAFAALPALASATYPNPYLADHGEPVENTGFTVGTDPAAEGEAGYHPRLETVSGKFLECERLDGEGEFETAETGWVKLATAGCHTTLGIKCTTEGQEAGTITMTKTPFHLKTVDHGGVQTPGVLITPGEGKANDGGDHFATFKCSFAGTVVIGGATPDPNNGSTPGLVGTIASPEEQVPSNTQTISFESEAPGVQAHRVVTNDNGETKEYDLKTSFNGGATETFSENERWIITFAEGMEPELLTTSE